MLKIQDKWVWDFWFARDGDDYHIFFLQAPKSLKDQVLRHFNVSVGHAVSQDLTHWTILPDALHPGPTGSWDDKSTWTGSIIHHAGQWYMLYTGASSHEKGLVQRIGLAVSEDLIHWEKHFANPLLEADPRWYETLDLTKWHDQAWRDPWVFYYQADSHYHAFITARVNYGQDDERGVIGHARSKDLIDWEVLPPVSDPGEFGHLEVPQLLAGNGRYYLLFSCPLEYQSKKWKKQRETNPQSGTHYLVSDHSLGPFSLSRDEFLVGDVQESLYSGKLIKDPADRWVFLAFHNFDPHGNFIGEISDPIPTTITSDGELRVLR
jgi:beta-fructofuranosidase